MELQPPTEELRPSGSTDHTAKHYGDNIVRFAVKDSDGQELTFELDMVFLDVKRFMLTPGKLRRHDLRTVLEEGRPHLEVIDTGVAVPLIERGDLTFMRARFIGDETGNPALPPFVAPAEDGDVVIKPSGPAIRYMLPHVDDPGGQAQDVKPMGKPHPPTPNGREQHELTHAPFKPWCDICVAAISKE